MYINFVPKTKLLKPQIHLDVTTQLSRNPVPRIKTQKRLMVKLELVSVIYVFPQKTLKSLQTNKCLTQKLRNCTGNLSDIHYD